MTEIRVDLDRNYIHARKKRKKVKDDMNNKTPMSKSKAL